MVGGVGAAGVVASEDGEDLADYVVLLVVGTVSGGVPVDLVATVEDRPLVGRDVPAGHEPFDDLDGRIEGNELSDEDVVEGSLAPVAPGEDGGCL